MSFGHLSLQMNYLYKGRYFSKTLINKNCARSFSSKSKAPSPAPKVTEVQTKTEIKPKTNEEETLGKLLVKITERFEYKDALRNVKQKVRFTYKEFQGHSDAVSDGILDICAKPGHRILSFMNNTVENVISHVGMNRIGVSYIPASPFTDPKDIVGLLDRFQPRVVFLNARKMGKDAIREAIPDLQPFNQDGKYLYSKRFPFIRLWVHTEGSTEVVPMLALRDLTSYERIPSLIPEAELHLSGNSQSVSSLKGDKEITWTHSQVIRFATAVGAFLDIKPTQRVGVSIPMYYHHSHAIGVWPIMMNGGVVTMSGVFPEESKKLWETLETEHVETWIADVQSFETLMQLGKGFPKYLKKVLLVHSGEMTSDIVKGANSLAEISILDPWAEKISDLQGKSRSLF